MEIIDLRHFSSADLRPLLAAECAAWNSQLDWDYSGSAEMILRYIDSKVLPGYAALERGRIFGYTFYVLEGSKGVLGGLFVDDEGLSSTASRSAAEHRLLTQTLDSLQRSPGIRRVEAQLLMHPTGAVTEPFRLSGFVRHPRWVMALPLAGTPLQAPLSLPPGLAIRRWHETDHTNAATLISEAYAGHVDAEVNDQYQSVGGSLRFLHNIIRFPGCGTFDPASSFVVADRVHDALIGVILCSDIRSDVGHITQICVLPQYRGQQVGETLLAQTAENLRQRRFVQVSLTVTEANRAAIHFYQRLGFNTRRVFDAFVWEA